ncbi:MAG: lipid-A-disaccharide synthase N-terminal domain-containing protein [Parachlamydiaceae bacterium]|nr:MAG: lipid-A-disaccharide synthase N-terminal domain-containing protein [Parachlamydiaceae bacterium]
MASFGFAGLILFNSRFWIQWWHAEQTQTSTLGRSFWWISLAGALCSIAYFARIQDPVNLIGPVIGMIPYVRNLMLLHKSKSPETAANNP